MGLKRINSSTHLLINSSTTFKPGDRVLCDDVLLGKETKGTVLKESSPGEYYVDIGGGVRTHYKASQLKPTKVKSTTRPPNQQELHMSSFITRATAQRITAERHVGNNDERASTTYFSSGEKALLAKPDLCEKLLQGFVKTFGLRGDIRVGKEGKYRIVQMGWKKVGNGSQTLPDLIASGTPVRLYLRMNMPTVIDRVSDLAVKNPLILYRGILGGSNAGRLTVESPAGFLFEAYPSVKNKGYVLVKVKSRRKTMKGRPLGVQKKTKTYHD